MPDTTKLLVEAARRAVHDIPERYHGYHAHLISRFTEVLRIQREEPKEAAKRSIMTLITGFTNEITAQRRGTSV